MASIFKRPGSDFWHIKFYDAANPLFDERGRRVQKREATGLRHTNSTETRNARVLEAQRTLAERTDRHAGHLSAQRWDAWVVDFISDPDRQLSDRTTERYLTLWRTLRMWLADLKVIYPRQLTYLQSAGYLKWRAKPDRKRGKYHASVNTAILEFKVFRWLVREAVRRGYAPGNPAREVVLKRTDPRAYANLSAGDVQFILDAIEREADPVRIQLRRAFLVARYHGVRLNETNVNPMKDVKIWEEARPNPKVQGPWPFKGEITFFQKGKRVRTKPLHPELIALFQMLRADGATETYPAPLPRWGNRWTRFFRKIKMPERRANVVFHSLRVTVENLLRTAGVPKEVRMKYLTHEKKGDVNSGYDRVEIEEMRQCHAPLNKTWV